MGGKIEGKVIDKSTGLPINKQDIYISCNQDKDDIHMAMSYHSANLTDDGSFTIANLASGRYQIEIRPRKRKYEKATYNNIDVNRGQKPPRASSSN